HGDREYIIEVHLDWITSTLFADCERSRWCCRREDRVHAFSKYPLKILLDQGAHLLRAQIVSVILPPRQHARLDSHLPANFLTNSPRPGVFVPCGDTPRVGAEAIPHAVVAGEIGGSFCWRNNVISRERITRVRQRDICCLGTSRFEPFDPLLP